MKLIVKCSCGHVQEVDFYGDKTERKNTIRYYEHHPCKECKAKQDAELIFHYETAMNLPSINGSEKQKAWARKIRAKFAEDWETLKTTKSETYVKNFEKYFFTEKSASFWINNRERTLFYFLAEWERILGGAK